MNILRLIGIKPKPKPKKEGSNTLSQKYAHEVWARNGNIQSLKHLINGTSKSNNGN